MFAIHAFFMFLAVGVDFLFGYLTIKNESIYEKTNIAIVTIDFFIQLCILQICWQCGGLARPI